MGRNHLCGPADCIVCYITTIIYGNQFGSFGRCRYRRSYIFCYQDLLACEKRDDLDFEATHTTWSNGSVFEGIFCICAGKQAFDHEYY